MPGRSDVVLDSWMGSMNFKGVRFDNDREDDKWSAGREVSILIEGEATDRATADLLRETLVQTNGYVATTGGTELQVGRRLPFGFTYRVRTRDARPPRAVDEVAADTNRRTDGERQ